MKILLVHNYYRQWGGEDSVVTMEIKLLQSKGHDVSLFTVHNDNISGLFRKTAVALLTVYNPWSKKRLSAAIAKFRPDIVHVHNFFPQLSPSVFDACQEAGVPAVMTLHNYRILCPTSFLYHNAKRRERSLKHSSFWTVFFRTYHESLVGTVSVALMVDFHKWAGTWNTKVDRFIALTNFAKNKFVDGGISPGKIVVKGNCIPIVKKPNSSTERKGALFVGRLSEEKGVRLFLDAWKGVDYPLRIVGDGPLRELCESAQSENITYLGRLDRGHVYAEMARAAFLVLPSLWYEMYPITIIEAFANGLPVITARLASLSELVKERITGLSFSAIEASNLRETVRWASTHPEEMQEMGKRARAHYEEFFEPGVNYAELMCVYEDVIRLRHGTRRP